MQAALGNLSRVRWLMRLIVAHLETCPVGSEAAKCNSLSSRGIIFYIRSCCAVHPAASLTHTRVFALDPQADNTQKHNNQKFWAKGVLEARFRFLADRFSHAANVSIFNEHAIRRFYMRPSASQRK
jgi:hypothetical protein